MISLAVCIGCAHSMKLSIGWAVLLGLLLSPAAGVAYLYMLLSGDRKPWRAALVGFILALLLVFLFLAAVGTFSHPSTPTANVNTTGTDSASASVPAATSVAQSSNTVNAPEAPQQDSSKSALPSNDANGNGVTTYIITCNQDVSSVSDCTSFTSGYTTVYSVADVNSQTVMISLVPSSGATLSDYVMQPYAGNGGYCTVVDADNWTCHHPNGAVDGLKNGVPFPYATSEPATQYTNGITTFELSAAEWLQLPASFRQS